jgi:hypothetical protein
MAREREEFIALNRSFGAALFRLFCLIGVLVGVGSLLPDPPRGYLHAVKKCGERNLPAVWRSNLERPRYVCRKHTDYEIE